MKRKIKSKAKQLKNKAPELEQVKESNEVKVVDEKEEEKEEESKDQGLSAGRILGKRKASHPQPKPQQLPRSQPKQRKQSDESKDKTAQEKQSDPVSKTKQALNLGESNSYKQLQDEHFKSVERERKYQQNKKLREQKEKDKEADQDNYINQFWNSKDGVQQNQKKSKKSGKAQEEDEEREVDSDREKDSNAIDMRREDAELEKILRDYNNEARQNKKKNESLLEKPLDLPFYKGIQLPTHLKWITIHSKANESVLMQEIHALDQEIKRLKEVKAIHKEFRRYVEMPLGVMSKPCQCCRGWSKKKHYCSHEFCEKPCKKQDEQMGQPKPAKESLIQQQIRNVYLQTMLKLQQMHQLGDTSIEMQTLQQAPYLQLMNGDPTKPFPGAPILFPMVDERNKRGRPPKKPKTAEMEQKERMLMQQKIIMHLQHQTEDSNKQFEKKQEEIVESEKKEGEIENQEGE